MTPRATLQIPPRWQVLDPERMAGTVLVLGASDSGKSTLVRWLVGELCRYHERVGWLDGDIGQSTLGLPGTQNLAVVAGGTEQVPAPQATFFVGATSPKGHMLPTLVGLQRLQERALSGGATAMVVDTTGLVAAETGGGALKQWLAELLRPRAVIALQQAGELEHLLASWRREGRFALHVLPVAEAVRARTREQRASHRRQQFRRYFRTAGMREVPLSRVAVYGGELANPGCLLALQDGEGLVLALAVLARRFPDRLQVVTPLADLAGVSSVRFGSLGIDPESGAELF